MERLKSPSSACFQVIWAAVILGALAFSTLLPTPARSQASTASGSIQGTITDPSGAVVPNAAVSIKSDDTGQVKSLNTDSAGYYNSGPLVPGHYTISVTASGFSSLRAPTVVQIGNVTSGNFKLSVGGSSTEIQVEASDVRVDTEQSQVQGVLTSQQIDHLPISGRNFLDLAQLEPGVQMQDGTGFDPTKAGYTSVSFNGVYGRTARIQLDGQDISDETVGTTVMNVSQGSIEEVQISRSDLDLSTELTSSGSVQVSTRSGTNKYHGQAFYQFRDERAGFAALPGGQSVPFQRNQFGGRVGGPIIPDKLFFFGNVERTKQSASEVVIVQAPFSQLSGSFTSPFFDTYSVGRLDYNAPRGIHAFARVGYEVNKSSSTVGPGGYSEYANRDNTPAFAYGADFVTGKFTHSLRGSYLKFHNMIGDNTAGGGVYDPLPSILLYAAGTGLASGPNYLAPQQTYQSDKQYRYDGSFTFKSHLIRYGVDVNRILGGGFASFFGLAPFIETYPAATGVATAGLDPSNPVNYPTYAFQLGNGEGYSSEFGEFGYPAGGQKSWRFGSYLGDSWKVTPTFNLNFGLRYSFDTGRIDADLAPIPCSDISSSLGSFAPCSGSSPLLSQFGAGLGGPVRQPYTDLGPQAGFAWQVTPKTVIRGGGGLYFENNIFNNELFSRPAKLQKGLFLSYPGFGCGVTSIPLPGGTIVTAVDGVSLVDMCNEPVSQSAPLFAKLQAEYQAATQQVGASSNGAFVGNTLTINGGAIANVPNYKVPRSVQMNLGVQRQLWTGGVVTADYVRNVGLHISEQIDMNHVGDARFLNTLAAVRAIDRTLAAHGWSNMADAISKGATIDDFAGEGLDSGAQYLSGYPSSYALGVGPGYGAAFPGINKLVGQGMFDAPVGRSVYNGLQTNFRQQTRHLFRGVTDSNFEISYTFSRFVTSAGGDQFLSPGAHDYASPTRFLGPDGLDRSHQFSFGGSFQTLHGPLVAIIGHVFSSTPTTLTLDNNGDTTGDIFRTDVTGDGTTKDILPGTNVGAFMRTVHGSTINKVINSYNSTQAGTLTPAGQALVNAHVLTTSQLTQLGAVKPTLANAPASEFGNGILRTFDLALTYPIHVRRISESFSVEPGFNAFNVFNFANFGGLGGTLGWAATGGIPGDASGTGDPSVRDQVRTGTGSGVFSQGAPRELEYTLKINF